MLRGGALVVLVALSSVRGLEPGPPSKRCGIAVESAAEMTPEKWHGTYHRRQPVLLTSTANGGMGSWAAMDKWTPEWLLENMGDHQLKIVDPQLLELSDDGRTVTRLAPRKLHEALCLARALSRTLSLLPRA